MFLPPQEISRKPFVQELAFRRDASRHDHPQIPRIYDWNVEALESNDLNFAFKGVWFSGTDLFLTADPRNIHHIQSSNFGNYPKGPDFKMIFAVLGDGILAVDSKLWVDLRKSSRTIFLHQDFLEMPEVEFGEAVDLGKHLALLQMKIVAVDIIRNYDFKIVKGHKIELVPSAILQMKHGLKATVRKKI